MREYVVSANPPNPAKGSKAGFSTQIQKQPKTLSTTELEQTFLDYLLTIEQSIKYNRINVF